MRVEIAGYSRGHDYVNATKVNIGKITLWFSYDDLVAFQVDDKPLVIRENDWGTTTGKHLNAICHDKSRRISAAEFEAAFQQVLVDHGL